MSTKGVKMKRGAIGGKIGDIFKWFGNNKPDYSIYIVTGMLILLGLIAVFSSTLASSGTAVLVSQIEFAVLGIVAMIFVSLIDFSKHGLFWAVSGTSVSVVLLVLTLFIGNEHNDTRRSIDIGPVSLQPSDVAKVTLILTLAYIFDRYHEQVIGYKPIEKGFLERISAAVNNRYNRPILNTSVFPILGAVILIGVYGVLVYLGSHMSGLIIITLIGLSMLYVSEIRKKWFVVGILMVAIVAGMWLNYGYKKGYLDNSSAVSETSSEESIEEDSGGSGNPLLKEYQYKRVRIWLDKDDTSYIGDRAQTNTALAAITSGGFFGKGLGKSTLNSHLTESQNDFVFSIWIETFGFLGGIVVMILFAVLVWRIVLVGINCPDRYGSLVAFGIAFALGIQTFLHIGVNIDLLPNTGISLPFFSSGGTSMVVYCGEIGIVLNISRRSKGYNKRIFNFGESK